MTQAPEYERELEQVIDLPLAEVRTDGGTQHRPEIREDVVAEYAALMRDGVEFPPGEVVFDKENNCYWLVAGFHRREACLSIGRSSFKFVVHEGTLEDARWESLATNKSHGLRRSHEEKQRVVHAALKHPNSVGLSDRQIARHCGVDHKTVHNWRKKLEATGEIPQSDLRTGADGRTINTRNIGTRPQQRYSGSSSPGGQGLGGGGSGTSVITLPRAEPAQASPTPQKSSRPAQPGNQILAVISNTSRVDRLHEQAPQPTRIRVKPGEFWGLADASFAHVLYCGEPTSVRFKEKLPEEVALSLAFPPTSNWQLNFLEGAAASLAWFADDQDEEALLEMVYHPFETTQPRDSVVFAYLPTPALLAYTVKKGCRVFAADPEPGRIEDAIAWWRQQGGVTKKIEGFKFKGGWKGC